MLRIISFCFVAANLLKLFYYLMKLLLRGSKYLLLYLTLIFTRCWQECYKKKTQQVSLRM